MIYFLDFAPAFHIVLIMKTNMFIKFEKTAAVASLKKEAARVGYVVEGNWPYNVKVTDHSPEAVSPGAEVFSAVQVREGFWQVHYSKHYWQLANE